MIYKSLLYIQEEDAADLERKSMKAVIRGASQNGYIGNDLAGSLIECVDLRNKIMHEYDMFYETDNDIKGILDHKEAIDKIFEFVSNELLENEKLH